MKLADGLSYHRMRTEDGTSFAHVLEIDCTQRRIGTVPVGPDYPVSTYYGDGTRGPQLAAAARALASVGCDFTATRFDGVKAISQPIHVYVLDGEVWTTGQRGGPAQFVVAPDGKVAIVPEHMVVKVDDIVITGVNANRPDGVYAFTSRGGQNQRPRFERHHVVLGLPQGWISTQHGRSQVYEVTKVMETGVPGVWPHQVVLESKDPIGLTTGQMVTWTQELRWGFTQIIGGAPMLRKDGKDWTHTLSITAEPPHGPDNWFLRRNPRTMLGVSEDGTTAWFVAVAGRLKYSKGLRLKAAGQLMNQLGAWDAMNLDGGGSTHMWTAGDGLVCDSCYGDGTLNGIRPSAYEVVVW